MYGYLYDIAKFGKDNGRKAQVFKTKYILSSCHHQMEETSNLKISAVLISWTS